MTKYKVKFIYFVINSDLMNMLLSHGTNDKTPLYAIEKAVIAPKITSIIE